MSHLALIKLNLFYSFIIEYFNHVKNMQYILCVRVRVRVNVREKVETRRGIFLKTLHLIIFRIFIKNFFVQT